MIKFIDSLKYSKGIKYQAREDFVIEMDIYPDVDVETPDISFVKVKRGDIYVGILTIKNLFGCDGPSGATIDWPRKHTMMGAFVHDALCKLKRLGLIPNISIDDIDRIAHECWIASKMWKHRAMTWWKALKKFTFYIDPRNKAKIYHSP